MPPLGPCQRCFAPHLSLEFPSFFTYALLLLCCAYHQSSNQVVGSERDSSARLVGTYSTTIKGSHNQNTNRISPVHFLSVELQLPEATHSHTLCESRGKRSNLCSCQPTYPLHYHGHFFVFGGGISFLLIQFLICRGRELLLLPHRERDVREFLKKEACRGRAVVVVVKQNAVERRRDRRTGVLRC